jgi:hypothetical protein
VCQVKSLCDSALLSKKTTKNFYDSIDLIKVATCKKMCVCTQLARGLVMLV